MHIAYEWREGKGRDKDYGEAPGGRGSDLAAGKRADGRAPARSGAWALGRRRGRAPRRLHDWVPARLGACETARLGRRPPRRGADGFLRCSRRRAVQRAQLLEVIFTSVGVFRYFRVAIGTCSSLPVMAVFTLSFQVAPSLKVTRRLKLHL